MIPSSTPAAEIAGTLTGGESRVMGIQMAALAEITDSMVNLYTDKHLAVLREYSTNARDAMVAAGKGDQPIHVVLPSSFDPQLVISDTGIGMSKDEVLNFYSQYGASDKRNSNEQVGSYGFGCKSAFTLADQFVVTAVKDGWRTVAVFYRDEHGIGTARIVSHEPVDESNGVTVTVPVKGHKAMVETASRFFVTWAPGTVLVDGTEPETFRGIALSLGPVSCLPPHQPFPAIGDPRYNAKINVVMGGVTYPIRDGYGKLQKAIGNWGYLPSPAVLYIDAGIGEVDIVPSREGLRDTDRTIQFLTDRLAQFDAALNEHVNQLVESAPTLLAATKLAYDWAPVLRCGGRRATASLSWHGQPISFNVTFKEPGQYEFARPTRRSRAPRLSRQDEIVCQVHQTRPVLAFTGVPDPAKPVRGLADYCREKGYEIVLPLTGTSYTNGWFDLSYPDVTVLDFTTWQADQKALRDAQRAAYPKITVARAQPKYEVISHDWYSPKQLTPKQINEQPVTKYYCPKSQASHEVAALLRLIDAPKSLVIRLGDQQRESTLLARVPGILPLSVLVEQQVAKQLQPYSAAQVRRVGRLIAVQAAGHQEEALMKSLFARRGEIQDPVALDLVRMFNAPHELDGKLRNEMFRFSGNGWTRATDAWQSFSQRVDGAAQDVDLSTRYPLLASLHYYWAGKEKDLFLDHVIAYFNGVHRMRAETSVSDTVEEVA
jgi:hypothetical protein